MSGKRNIAPASRGRLRQRRLTATPGLIIQDFYLPCLFLYEIDPTPMTNKPRHNALTEANPSSTKKDISNINACLLRIQKLQWATLPGLIYLNIKDFIT